MQEMRDGHRDGKTSTVNPSLPREDEIRGFGFVVVVAIAIADHGTDLENITDRFHDEFCDVAEEIDSSETWLELQSLNQREKFEFWKEDRWNKLTIVCQLATIVHAN